MYTKKKDYKELTWFTKVASDASLEREEISIFLIAKTFLNLGNGLDIPSRSLGEVVKP